MKFMRNSEIRRMLLLHVLLAVAACILTLVKDPSFLCLVGGLCVLFSLLYLVSTYRRYQRIEELSTDLDRLLHGDMPISLERYAEGELCILQCEIEKMTVRLREQSQRLMEDKKYLADSIADISHQIRTPLTTINLLVSFLSEPDVEEERRIKLTHELYDLLSRIDWLITALLKLSKLDAGTAVLKTETVPLAELIRRATEALLVPIELKGQRLNVHAEGNFYGDVSWTGEAVLNIVKNCMEHTPSGGELTVSASENALYSEIIIKDNGSGIDREDLPHIFERFYKGKNTDDKSFGIGLALAQRIVTAQNGTVKAENNTEKGARFTLRFYKGIV